MREGILQVSLGLINMLTSVSTHFFTNGTILFLMVGQYSIIYIHYIYLSMDKHLAWHHILTNINNASTNTKICYLYSRLAWIPSIVCRDKILLDCMDVLILIFCGTPVMIFVVPRLIFISKNNV